MAPSRAAWHGKSHPGARWASTGGAKTCPKQRPGPFFASRFQLAGHGFCEYSRAAGSDALADKGIFGARLAIGNAWLCVFHTHLQSSLSERSVRTSQLREIHRFVRSALQRVPRSKKPFALLCGDLNVVGESEAGLPTDEYGNMISRLGSPRDLFRDLHDFKRDAGFTWDGAQNAMIPRNDKDKQRLDYVLAWDRLPELGDDDRPPAIGRVDVQDIAVRRFETAKPKVCLSDHFAVDAAITIAA